MPLVNINADRAFANAKSNAQNSWPKRGDPDNRVEPLAKPYFTTSFKLVPGESVFTIGSCFARNVEGVLESLGFDVPMRHLTIVKGTFEDAESNPNIFNNYAVPSILNELEWAVNPETPFDPSTCLLELTNNGYCDLHLTRLLKPVPLEEALARRARIKDGMSKVTSCRVIVITLGLVEAWWDTVAHRYLNIAPPKQAAKRFPGRFELHVLGYREILRNLEQIIALLRKFGRRDHRVILTISPVPLGLTFTDQDVMVANAYSKSVLRAAAQEIWTKYDHVDYFPSFESVTLSDRSLAWQDDLRHVTPGLITQNVNTMVAAYSDAGNSVSQLLAEAQSLEKARAIKEAAELYKRILREEADLVAAKLGAARCFGELHQVDEAKELLVPMLDVPETSRDAAIALAAVYRLNKMQAEFEQVAARLKNMSKDTQALRELIVGYFSFENFDLARQYCEAMRERLPRSPIPYEYRGRIAVARQQWNEAVEHFVDCVAVQQSSPTVYAALGHAQMALGRIDDARDSFERALVLNPKTRVASEGLKEISAHSAELDTGPLPSTALADENKRQGVL
jgi:tetratricopeptide (TPR) repeat protein